MRKDMIMVDLFAPTPWQFAPLWPFLWKLAVSISIWFGLDFSGCLLKIKPLILYSSHKRYNLR